MRLMDLPLRVLLAAAVTVAVVVALGAQAVFTGGDDGSADAPTDPTEIEETDETSPLTADSDASAVEAEPEVEIQGDWYPKRSSRYSARSPEPLITTVPPGPEA